MQTLAKKHKESNDKMKSCIANSNEKMVDSKVLHCVLEKMRLKGNHIQGCYDPVLCQNFNHFAIQDKSSSIEDNLQLSSKNEVEINDVLEVLPEFSPYDQVTDHCHKFIPPVDQLRQNLCLQTMESSEGGFKFVHFRSVVESEWDSPELVQAFKSDCVQSMICCSLIKASPDFKLSVQGFFYKICLQDEEKSILSLLSKSNVGVIAISNFIENASPEFSSAMIFEPVDTDMEDLPTAIVYLAIFPQFSALKLPTYSLSGLQSYLDHNQKSQQLFCAAPIKQAIWYKNNGFCLFSVDPKKENKEVPDKLQQSIFNNCWTKIIVTQLDCNMTRTIVEKIVSNSSTSNLKSWEIDTSLSNTSIGWLR